MNSKAGTDKSGSTDNTDKQDFDLPDKVKIAAQLELLALSDPDRVVNPSEAAETLRIKYHTITTTITRLIEREIFEELADTPESRVVEIAPCPTCGHITKDPAAGPQRKYFRLSDARAAEMATEWPDERVDAMIAELERRALAEAEAKGLNTLKR